MKLHCGNLYIITKCSMNVEDSAKENVCLTKCSHVHIANIDLCVNCSLEYFPGLIA